MSKRKERQFCVGGDCVPIPREDSQEITIGGTRVTLTPDRAIIREPGEFEVNRGMVNTNFLYETEIVFDRSQKFIVRRK